MALRAQKQHRRTASGSRVDARAEWRKARLRPTLIARPRVSITIACACTTQQHEAHSAVSRPRHQPSQDRSMSCTHRSDAACRRTYLTLGIEVCQVLAACEGLLEGRRAGQVGGQAHALAHIGCAGQQQEVARKEGRGKLHSDRH